MPEPIVTAIRYLPPSADWTESVIITHGEGRTALVLRAAGAGFVAEEIPNLMVYPPYADLIYPPAAPVVPEEKPEGVDFVVRSAGQTGRVRTDGTGEILFSENGVRIMDSGGVRAWFSPKTTDSVTRSAPTREGLSKGQAQEILRRAELLAEWTGSPRAADERDDLTEYVEGLIGDDE